MPSASCSVTTAVQTAGSRSAVGASTMPATGPAAPRSRARAGRAPARRAASRASTTTSVVGPAGGSPAGAAGLLRVGGVGEQPVQQVRALGRRRRRGTGPAPVQVPGVRQPLRPVPVAPAVVVGEQGHPHVGRSGLHRRLAQQPPRQRQRGRAVAHDADHPAVGQVDGDRDVGQHRVPVEDRRDVVGVPPVATGAAGLVELRGPADVAEADPEAQQVGGEARVAPRAGCPGPSARRSVSGGAGVAVRRRSTSSACRAATACRKAASRSACARPSVRPARVARRRCSRYVEIAITGLSRPNSGVEQVAQRDDHHRGEGQRGEDRGQAERRPARRPGSGSGGRSGRRRSGQRGARGAVERRRCRRWWPGAAGRGRRSARPARRPDPHPDEAEPHDVARARPRAGPADPPAPRPRCRCGSRGRSP